MLPIYTHLNLKPTLDKQYNIQKRISIESRAYQKQVKENIKAITKQTDRYWELIKEPELRRQDARNEGEK